MQLAAIGRDGAMERAGPGVTGAEGRRLSIGRPDSTEWYHNGDGGIEQGMTLDTRPEGTGKVKVAFDISGGDLAPSLEGQTLLFSGNDGPVFRYDGLFARDTRSRNLPARLSLSGNTLAWEIDDAGAMYPVTVDPLVTQVKILNASNQKDNDLFGGSVAVSGSTAVVGAYGAGSGGSDRGEAYVFTIGPAPAYTGIAPVTGANTGPVAVTITGNNFDSVPVVKLKKAGETDITATGVVLTGSTTIGCTFDLTGAATGAWDVEITNPDGKSVTGANAFTVTLPTPPVDTGTGSGPGSDSGSESGDTPGTPGVQIVAIAGPLHAGERSTVAIASRSDTPLPGPVQVIEITVVPAGDTGEAMFTVRPVDPVDAVRLPGNPPAAYIGIAMYWAREDAVREAGIRFTVPESWLAERGIDPATVVMMRYHDGVWTALPTRLVSQGGGICTYVATTPGFSYFAVTRNATTAAVTTPGRAAATPSAPVTGAVTPAAPPQPAAKLAETAWPVPTATTAVPPAPPAEIPALPVVGIAAGSAGLLAGAVIVRRWWIHRQNPALFEEC